MSATGNSDIYLAHIDESYSEEGRFYFVGCAIGTQEQWDQVESGLDVLRQKAHHDWGVPIDAEFHAYEIASGRKAWKALRGKHRAATGLTESILQVAWDANIRYIIRGVDTVRLKGRYKYPEPPHLVCLRHVLERVDNYALGLRLEQQVIVIMDEHPDGRQWERSIEEYRRTGTGGYQTSELTRISDPILSARSHLSAGPEIADQVVFLRRRIEEIPTPHPQEAVARKRLVALIRPRTYATGVWRP